MPVKPGSPTQAARPPILIFSLSLSLVLTVLTVLPLLREAVLINQTSAGLSKLIRSHSYPTHLDQPCVSSCAANKSTRTRTITGREEVLHAIQLKQTGKITDAIAAFEHVLLRNPTDVRAIWFLGKLYEQTGRWSEAVRVWQRSPAVATRVSIDAHRRSVSAYKSGDIEAADALLHRSLEIEPRNFEALYTLSDVLRQRDPLKSIWAARTAVGIDPWDTDKKQYALGQAHFIERNFHESAAHFERAISLNSSNALAWHFLGASYFFLGRQLEAKVALIRVLDLVPNHVTSRELLANIAVTQGDHVEASCWLGSAERMRPLAHLSADSLPPAVLLEPLC